MIPQRAASNWVVLVWAMTARERRLRVNVLVALIYTPVYIHPVAVPRDVYRSEWGRVDRCRLPAHCVAHERTCTTLGAHARTLGREWPSVRGTRAPRQWRVIHARTPRVLVPLGLPSLSLARWLLRALSLASFRSRSRDNVYTRNTEARRPRPCHDFAFVYALSPLSPSCLPLTVLSVLSLTLSASRFAPLVPTGEGTREVVPLSPLSPAVGCWQICVAAGICFRFQWFMPANGSRARESVMHRVIDDRYRWGKVEYVLLERMRLCTGPLPDTTRYRGPSIPPHPIPSPPCEIIQRATAWKIIRWFRVPVPRPRPRWPWISLIIRAILFRAHVFVRFFDAFPGSLMG